MKKILLLTLLLSAQISAFCEEPLDLRVYEVKVSNGVETNKFVLRTVSGKDVFQQVSDTATYAVGCDTTVSPVSPVFKQVNTGGYTLKLSPQKDSNVVTINWNIKKLAKVEQVKTGDCNLEKVAVSEFGGSSEMALAAGDDFQMAKTDKFQVSVKRVN